MLSYSQLAKEDILLYFIPSPLLTGSKQDVESKFLGKTSCSSFKGISIHIWWAIPHTKVMKKCQIINVY